RPAPGARAAPARPADDARACFLVDPGAAGVTLERSESTTGEPLWTVRLAGARAAAGNVVGDARAGAEIVTWIVRRVIAGLCAVQAGVCAEALRPTAAHGSEPEQVGPRSAACPA